MVSILSKKKKIKLNKTILKMLRSEDSARYCFKCGKDMTDGNGQKLIGVEFGCYGLSRDTDFAKRQLGQYSEYFNAENTKMCFCWECWINSFMKK